MNNTTNNTPAPVMTFADAIAQSKARIEKMTDDTARLALMVADYGLSPDVVAAPAQALSAEMLRLGEMERAAEMQGLSACCLL